MNGPDWIHPQPGPLFNIKTDAEANGADAFREIRKNKSADA